MDDDSATITNTKEVYLFGRDISKIPCFRNSFLYGISGGIGAGLVYFLFTSKPQMATHCAFASFTVITLCYWFQCRYQYSKTKFQMLQTQEMLKKHIMYEGTQFEKELKKQGIKEV